MGKITGFLDITREERQNAPKDVRRQHWHEFVEPLGESKTRDQAARCMDCGIPYCHAGCPVDNQIPEWNDLITLGDWKGAAANLHSTNNFPEITGRICPAPCEEACTLNLEDQPVTIKTIECAIADRAWEEGWMSPHPPTHKSGKTVSIIGSGPAGLACAQQLARNGHEVHVYEKNAYPGGLLRYGIPDFKLEKHHVARRITQMEAEGVTFHTRTHIQTDDILHSCDALVLACGAEVPRDLPVDGRDKQGIHFAMDFLTQQNRRLQGEPTEHEEQISAQNKHVVVIGGGDTGSDCIGTSFRQRAKSVTQLEILPKPPVKENKMLVWPDWPLKLRTSSSQEEGAQRDWAVMTKAFLGTPAVEGLRCVRVNEQMEPITNSEFTLPADLVLLAMGFVHPTPQGLLRALGVALDPRGNVAASTADYKTSLDKVFAAGDLRRGQSLVVWAIREGRLCAQAVHTFLTDS